MKVLTGEAYWNFRRWIFDTQGIKPKFIDDLNEKLLQCYLIEWLDSVGIYIETGVYPQEDGSIGFSWTIFGDNSVDDFELYSERQQATEKAIEKAIEIYNEKHK